MIKAKKLRGGPGMTGRMQPTKPVNETNSPRIIIVVIKDILLLENNVLSKPNHRFTPLDTYCIEYILFQKFKLLDKSLISKGPLSNGGARELSKY